jgi:hypothetical protein
MLPGVKTYWIVMVDYGGMESKRHIFITDGERPKDCRVVSGPYTDAMELIEALNGP